MHAHELHAHRVETETSCGLTSYLDVGRGRPTVFIHGIFTNSLLWRHVITDVASPQRRCIAIDLPGHGHTPFVPAGTDVSLTGLARRIIALCDHLQLDRFDLVANDTGSAVAQIVAAQLGDRLATLTLTNGDTEGNTPPHLFTPIIWAARPNVLAKVGPAIAARRSRIRALLLPSYQNAGAIPDDIIESYGKPVLGTPASSRAFARLLAALSSHDLRTVRPALSKLSTPTLIVWGTGDIFFPLKWGKRLAALIPSATELVTLKGARLHFPDYRASELLPHLHEHWEQHP
jgi:pimeloyl-ACP methyl ester carboxylesterase